MTEEKLKVMADIDIHAVDEDTIASFEESISLKGKTPVQTLNRFFNKGYNPYFRKKDGCIVKISFVNNGTSLSEAVAAMLSYDA